MCGLLDRMTDSWTN